MSTDAANETPVAAAVEETQAVVEDESIPRKVFVGNLPFDMKEEDLKTLFAEAGNVVSTQIVRRGRRSLGYGFVEFPTEEEAQAAMTKMDKKQHGDRALNCEPAKPRALPTRRPRRNRRKKAAAEGAEEGETQVENGEAGERKAKSRRNRTRGRRGRRAGNADGEQTGEEGDAGAAASAAAGEGGARKPRRRRGRKTARSTDGAAGDDAASTRPARRARQPSGPKEPSETLVFVANLPFSTTDDELAKMFDGLSVAEARVATKANGRSKGFGFVDFADHAAQQAAVEREQFTVGDRTVTVRVAHKQLPREEADADAPAGVVDAVVADAPSASAAAAAAAAPEADSSSA